MEAKLTRVSGNDVHIERRDGLTTKVDIAIFSIKDQEFIRDWAKIQMITDGAIEVRFTTEVSDKSSFESFGTGVLRKTWKQAYGIVLTNKAYEDLKNIRIEYMILKFEDAIAAQKRSEGELLYIKDETSVEFLKAGSEAHAETKQFSMQETKLASGYRWASGGKSTSEDEMRGIWIKVYVGDTLATEVSRPESVQRNYKWQ